MLYKRRDLGKLALASLPLAGVLKPAKVDSVFDSIQFGIITYSFNRIASPTLFGQGDVPMKAVLQLLKKGQYGFPANIEWEPSLPIPADSSLVGEIKKALAYCKGCLA
jgi:hypothetical protein